MFAIRLILCSSLLLIPGCILGVAAAGAAIGIWIYDEQTDNGGEIILRHPPETVYRTTEQIARANGTEVETYPGSYRVQCQVEDAEVSFETFIVAGDETVSRLRVTAQALLRGRKELARDLALQVQDQLGGISD